MRGIHAIITISARPGLELIDFVMKDLVKSEKYG